MDINDLNKSQLLLLAVLLSFVTSIATGITTVTLMQQAPESITVPINRVVQQTVEKFVPVPGKTQTVVVKEEDLVVDAIAKNRPAVFAITRESFGGVNNQVSVGNGFVLNSEGVIVTDASLVAEDDDYFIENASGRFQTEYMFTNEAAGVSFLKIGEPAEGTNQATLTVPVQADLTKMKTGQKVLVLGESISSFIFEGGSDIRIPAGSGIAGGLVLNLDGEALGIALGGSKSFASIALINEALKPTP